MTVHLALSLKSIDIPDQINNINITIVIEQRKFSLMKIGSNRMDKRI